MESVLVGRVIVDIFDDVDLKGKIRVKMFGRHENETVLPLRHSASAGYKSNQVIFSHRGIQETQRTYPTAGKTDVSIKFLQQSRAMNSPQKAGQTVGPCANFQKSAITRAPL